MAILLVVLLVSILPSPAEPEPTPTPLPTQEPTLTPMPTPTVVNVWIDAPDEAAPGTIFIATVNIGEVRDFDAAQYDVTYDPDVIKVTDVTGGLVDGTWIPVDGWLLIPLGVQGTVRIINNVPGTPGVSGSGYLAEIHFRIIGSEGETSTIAFIDGSGEPPGELLLGNIAEEEIEATWIDGSVQVGSW